MKLLVERMKRTYVFGSIENIVASPPISRLYESADPCNIEKSNVHKIADILHETRLPTDANGFIHNMEIFELLHTMVFRKVALPYLVIYLVIYK